ncbi:MAG: 2-phosphosulfolactate phosphatase [Nocardioides sp.]|uniref:2-phosphosulfolactate phosphatase n=1 Tax=Nocardioides sp. TaxID=35761 RepID=UPI0039E568AA
MASAVPEHTQADHRIRMEWGPTGAEAVGSGTAYAVVIDILSFTTTLTVAVERGMRVWPHRWRDESAAAYAESMAAVLAVGRLEGEKDATERVRPAVSLSPAAMNQVDGVERVVLPSPNGSTISALLAGTGARVLGASLRNATAVARWIAARATPAESVGIIAAGERWPDGSLRPAVEDLWGAGAVVHALLDAGVPPDDLSPEAWVAADSYELVAPRLAERLRRCASGQELIGRGYAEDVEIAAEHDASGVVPLLCDGAFVAG